MIYKDHDFTENFCCAIGYQDEPMMKDILYDELSRLIIDEKSDVVKLLRNNSINVSINDDPQVIANTIINEIEKSNDFIIKSISDMISKNRFDEKKYQSFIGDKKLSADGKKSSKLFQNIGAVLKSDKVQEGASDVISKGLKSVFNKEKPDETSKNTAAMNERLKMSQASKTKKKLNLKVLAIITVIGLTIGILGYKLYKSSHQISPS